MPEFTIIAGPNGAGKSSFSQGLSARSALIFDPDEEKRIIWSRFPEISDEAVESELTRVYEKFETDALDNNLDFTIETNLRNDFLVERAKVFRQKGYQINLIFLMLQDVEDSMDRVDLRVAQKGHFVDTESIKTNFELSRKNAINFAGQFDNIMLFDASSSENLVQHPVVVAIFKSDASRYFVNRNAPKWISGFIYAIGRAFIKAQPPSFGWRTKAGEPPKKIKRPNPQLNKLRMAIYRIKHRHDNP